MLSICITVTSHIRCKFNHILCTSQSKIRVRISARVRESTLAKTPTNKSTRVQLDSRKLSDVSHKLNTGESKDSCKLHQGESKWTLVKRSMKFYPCKIEKKKKKIHAYTTNDTKRKIYQCEHCQKHFTQRDALKYHIRTHTKEKLFQCEPM